MRRSPTRDFVVGLFVLAGLAAIAYLSLSVGGFSYSGPRGFALLRRRSTRSAASSRARRWSSRASRSARSTAIALDRRLPRPGHARPRPGARSCRSTPSASIVTAGVLGDRYVSLQLGGEDEMLKPGDEIDLHRVGRHPRALDRQAHPQHRRRRRSEERAERWRQGHGVSERNAPPLSSSPAPCSSRRCSPPAARPRPPTAPTTTPGSRFNRKIFWFNDKARRLRARAGGARLGLRHAEARAALDRRTSSTTCASRSSSSTTCCRASRAPRRSTWAASIVNTTRRRRSASSTRGPRGACGPNRGLRPDARPVGHPAAGRISCCRSSAPRTRATPWACAVDSQLRRLPVLPVLLRDRRRDDRERRSTCARCFSNEVASGREASLDYYVFVRNAYVQRRRALINDAIDVGNEGRVSLYDVEITSDRRSRPAGRGWRWRRSALACLALGGRAGAGASDGPRQVVDGRPPTPCSPSCRQEPAARREAHQASRRSSTRTSTSRRCRGSSWRATGSASPSSSRTSSSRSSSATSR